MMKIALIAGHNPKERGAFSPLLQEWEYDYAREICNGIKAQLPNTVDIYLRRYHGSYKHEMDEILKHMNQVVGYVGAIEIHFNMYNGTANGAAVLAHHKSPKGIQFAKVLLDATKRVIPNLRIRSIVKVTQEGQRGGYGIFHSYMPYILSEPFFGDSKKDCEIAKNKQLIIDSYVAAIRQWLKHIGGETYECAIDVKSNQSKS